MSAMGQLSRKAAPGQKRTKESPPKRGRLAAQLSENEAYAILICLRRW